MKKTHIQTIIIGILVLLLILSVVRNNGLRKENNDMITQMQLNQQTFDSIKNLYGEIVIQQGVVITSSKTALKAVTDSLFHLKASSARKIKDVIAYYKGITKTSIKNVEVPYIDTVKTKIWEDSVKRVCNQVIAYYENNYIQVPRNARDSTIHYKANLTANISGIRINELSIPDSQYIRFATMKGGLLKKDITGKRHLFMKKRIIAQVLHTNPLITVTGQNSAIYQAPPHPKWLERAIILAAGIYVGTNIQ